MAFDSQTHPFTMRVRRRRGAVTLHLYGRFDLSSKEHFAARLEWLQREGSLSLLTLDLSALNSIDSNGVRLILAAMRRCDEDGTDFSVTPGGGHVQKVFEAQLVSQIVAYLETRAPA